MQQREMCYLVNRSCHTAVCGVQTKQNLPYSCLFRIDLTKVAIQLSVLYRPSRRCHTALCALETKQKSPFICLCCIDQTEFAIQLSVLYRPNSICHTAVCAVQTKQQLPYSCLCCIHQTPDSCPMQLSIFIHHPYVSNHQITITIHQNILCAIQLQFLYVHFSPHYSIQSATVMQ